MKLRFLATVPLLVLACSSDGGDGSGGTQQKMTVAEVCEKMVSLQCQNSPPDVGTCTKVFSSMVEKCPTEADPLLTCGATGTWSCSTQGEPGVAECEAEAKAFSICAMGGNPVDAVDYAITDVNFPATLEAGGPYKVTVKNIGTVAADKATVAKVKLSPDLGYDDPDDVDLMHLDVAPLGPGESVTLEYMVEASVVPSAAGSYYLMAKADHMHALSDPDRDNNLKISDPYTVP